MRKGVVIIDGILWYEFDSEGLGTNYVDLKEFGSSLLIVIGLIGNIYFWYKILTFKF